MIIIPRKHYTQPQGRVEIAPEWSGYVRSAAIGGTFFDIPTQSFETFSRVFVGTSVYGTADIANPFANYVVEPKEHGTSFLIIAALTRVSASGIHQIIALDNSGPGQRRFQFRVNGNNLDHIRFNTAGVVTAPSCALGLAVGQSAVVVGWSNGLSCGAISPVAEASAMMSGTPSAWAEASDDCNWFARVSAGSYQEASSNNLSLRAVLTDPGSQEVRRDLQRNPWQIFKADPVRIYSFPSGPILIPTLSGASFAGRIPSVSLSY